VNKAREAKGMLAINSICVTAAGKSNMKIKQRLSMKKS